MKKRCILFLLSTLLSCAKYPHVPYLVGESHFNIDTIKRMAPYKMSNDVLAENEYAIYNLPPNISGVNKRKDWGVIVEKHKAYLIYSYSVKDDNIYIGGLLNGMIKK